MDKLEMPLCESIDRDGAGLAQSHESGLCAPDHASSAVRADCIPPSTFDVLKAHARLSFADRIPSIQDQLEWGDLCLAEGLRGSARMLYQIAFVRQGLSIQLRAEQASRLAQAGLPPAGGCRARPRKAGGTIELAIDELRQLACLLSPQVAARAKTPAEPQPYAIPHVPIEAPRAGAIHAPSDLAGTIGQLYRFLSTPTSPEQHPAAAGELMSRLEAADAHVPDFDYRTFRGASLPVLAAAIAFAGLQDYIERHRDLSFPPLGSATILNALARLDSFGLGPYLGNVQLLARNSGDIFELAGVAVSAGETAGACNADTALWAAFLSRQVKGPLLFEVVDTLGDRDERVALAYFFEREAAKAPDRIDVSLLTRLRDASLDNLDYTLAGRAQRLIAQLRPGVAHEWEILGNIEGSAGRIGTAEQAFTRCLELQPDNEEDVKKRLFALRSRTFGPCVIAAGYATPEDRRLNRLRRRENAARRDLPLDGLHPSANAHFTFPTTTAPVAPGSTRP